MGNGAGFTQPAGLFSIVIKKEEFAPFSPV
jgi:hypothetical protein